MKSKEQYIIEQMIENPELVLWQEKHLINRFFVDSKEIKRCITIARKKIGTNEIIMDNVRAKDIKEVFEKEGKEAVTEYYKPMIEELAKVDSIEPPKL